MRWKLKAKSLLVVTFCGLFLHWFSSNSSDTNKNNNDDKNEYDANRNNNMPIWGRAVQHPRNSTAVANVVVVETSQPETTLEGPYLNLPRRYHVPRLSHPSVPRALGDAEYETLTQLLRLVDALFTRHGIPYFMMYGTLLGSYVFHDVIPWDDDCDVLANNASKTRIMELLDEEGDAAKDHGLQAYCPQPFLLKIFFRHSPQAGKRKKYPWRFPFIDVAFFVEWNKDGGIGGDHGGDGGGGGDVNIRLVKVLDKFHPMSLSSEWVFPLHRRPLGPLWLPAPANTRRVLQAKQGIRPFVCSTNGWNHRTEDYYPEKQVDCEELKSHYPYVIRTPYKDGTYEGLVLNGTEYYKVFVDERFRDSTGRLRSYLHDKR